MTDEEVKKISLRVYGTPYPNIHVRLAAAVQAGYQAAMEEAKKHAMEETKKHYDDLRAEDWSYKSSWEMHGEWLDEQAKKEGT